MALTPAEPPNPGVEVVEGEREVARVAPRRVEPEARGPENADADEGQHLEANERRLLRQLVDGDAACGENRHPNTP